MTTTLTFALQANLAVIHQGIALLRSLGNERYITRLAVCYNSSVGGHVRHIVEHYQSFLSGLGEEGIDYERRARDPKIENDSLYAGTLLEEVAVKLEETFRNTPDRALRLCAETAAGTVTSTSALRELEFLLSHTIHHYALIAVIVKLQGFEPEATFGVAPSTLRHQQSLAACAR